MTLVRTRNFPTGANRSEELWLEERYWGHRLWDRQSPWLTFLEFLNLARSAHQESCLFDFERSQYPSPYHALSRLHLRNILFNNEQLLFRTDGSITDNTGAWRQWLTWMNENAQGLGPHQRDFSYLKDRFDSFHDFAQLVRALRSCVVEADSNKRWSSRFIFPFGSSAIFEDLDVKPTTAHRDYVNFGRSGELLYHMVSRAAQRDRLRELFPKRVLGSNKWTALLRQLQPPVAETLTSERGTETFLPYDQHPNFDLLAQDWIALLELELPGLDVVPYLVAAGSWSLLLYHLHTSALLLGRDQLPAMICEVIAPRKTLVREQAVESFETNSALSLEAVDAVLARFEASAEWQISGPQQEKWLGRARLLNAEFWWKDDTGTSDPEELWQNFKRTVTARHRQHFGLVHRAFGRGIGLVSKRGTNRLRYAPTDALLRCFVLTNVRKRMEYQEFLSTLYRRYGLVFGEHEAAQVLLAEDMDRKPFQSNSLRLEQRLRSLGLLKRLSDACAYVENPYSG